MLARVFCPGDGFSKAAGQEDADDLAFVKLVTPRALEVLCTLARASDLHCEFTSSAIRHSVGWHLHQIFQEGGIAKGAFA